MSFVYECNKNNRYDIMRDEFAWHSKLLTNYQSRGSKLIPLLELTDSEKKSKLKYYALCNRHLDVMTENVLAVNS